MKAVEKITTETTYEGKVNNITLAKDFYYKTDTVNIGNNLIEDNADLTFLNFISNGKTLLVSDRNIKNNISWDMLDERKLVFGNKVIEINSIKYKVRLLTASEWDNLIVKHTPLNKDSNYKDIYSWVQNVYSINDLKKYYSTYRVIRGSSPVSGFDYNTSSTVYTDIGWRQVLEML